MLLNLLLREPLKAIRKHLLRSGLTTLGIMIGIAAIVLVVGLGEEGSRRAQAELQKLGDNLVWIEAGSRNVAGVRTGTHGMTTLTMEDEEAIVREVPGIKSCTPQIDGNVQLGYGNRNWNARWRGETPDYLAIKKWEVAEGSAFSMQDVEHSASKILIGRTVREQLFGAGPAVGETVRAQGQLFEVVGILAAKGQSADGRDQDDWILLPHTTAGKKIRGKRLTYLDDILCSATTQEEVNLVIDRVVALLRQRHQIQPGAEDDFNIRRPDEVLKAQVDSSRALSALLISMASVSLLVGGIGIMNVMLASVLQRTREIGLRLAVGARSSHVLLQFLGEAVTLSLLGGVCGIALSLLGAWMIDLTLGWKLSLSPVAGLFAFLSSLSTGLVFGTYPALRASRLDPIEALRHE